MNEFPPSTLPLNLVFSDSETESLPDIYQKVYELPENLYEPLEVPESPVIYQEVNFEDDTKKVRERKRTFRRKRKLKPTFISYITVDRSAQEEKHMPIYDKLYDPTLCRGTEVNNTSATIYDKLLRHH